MNGKIISLHLQFGEGPSVSIPCLLQDSSHIYWFHSHRQSTRKKQRIPKWDPTSNKLYGTALAYLYKKSKAKRSRLETQP